MVEIPNPFRLKEEFDGLKIEFEKKLLKEQYFYLNQ
ncbi:hypothetical protein LVIS_1623 [Levilactobacillus brevis ATCC 367]|uniref:Uncharacterized protein n=1 Tax=Levilactobacillus brevis (strain ATCC 367 / BCRC 12310 / CIP 105137 / JCM 1170 / LMG 11437 / NCIMB 947 / NCTC 947) TaxID=387344 RepID=Q03Q23_LEVBA|nr:hypothetical protein LVIS_1623 [Levilactobacillus brevis ATCC 367]